MLVLWVVTLNIWVGGARHYDAIRRLHRQDPSKTSKLEEVDTFLRNDWNHSTALQVLHTRKQKYAVPPLISPESRSGEFVVRNEVVVGHAHRRMWTVSLGLYSKA
jgi:hypothetical protein